MGLFSRKALPEAPQFCYKCGAPLTLRTYIEHYNPASGQPEEHMALACTQIEDTLLPDIRHGHTFLMEGDMLGQYQIPLKLALYYDRKFDRRTREALARRKLPEASAQ